MGMQKRTLWLKILLAVVLMCRRGWLLILGVGLKLRFVEFVLGTLLAFAGAILSKSSRRKLLLWGAVGTAAGMALGIARVSFTGLTDKEPPRIPSSSACSRLIRKTLPTRSRRRYLLLLEKNGLSVAPKSQLIVLPGPGLSSIL